MKCFCVFLAWSSGKSVRMWWVPLRAPQWSGACTELPQHVVYRGVGWISVTWVCQNLKQVRARWPQIGYKCELNVLTQSYDRTAGPNAQSRFHAQIQLLLRVRSHYNLNVNSIRLQCKQSTVLKRLVEEDETYVIYYNR